MFDRTIVRSLGAGLRAGAVRPPLRGRQEGSM